MGELLCWPMDACLLLERGRKLLMLRRAPGAAYAAGLLCPPRVTSKGARTPSALLSVRQP